MLKIQVIGNLGNDCQVNFVNGKQVLNFSVCKTEKYKDKNGVQNQKSFWVNCSYFNESKIAPYLKKGTLVFCEGKPDVKVWQDKQGLSHAQQTMIVSSIQLLGSNNNNQNSQPSNQQSSYTQPSSSGFSASEVTDVVEGLPF